MKIFRNSFCLSLILVFFISAGFGCASTRKTTTTSTTVQVTDDSHQPVKAVEQSTTTTTSTETKPRPTGVVGGLFHIIGSVIAFPFIVIGGFFRMIF